MRSSTVFGCLLTSALCLATAATVCQASDELEQRITDTLIALRTVENPNPPDSPFKPFAVIESPSTGHYVQFRQSKPDTFYIDIPISLLSEVDGESSTETYLDKATVDSIKAYMSKWNNEIKEIVTDGIQPGGRVSYYRTLDADITIDEKDYGKMVLGLFTECFGEDAPLELNIIFQPEG